MQTPRTTVLPAYLLLLLVVLTGLACAADPQPTATSTAESPPLLPTLTPAVTRPTSPPTAAPQASATAGPSPTATPEPGRLTYNFSPLTASGDRALVQRGVEHADRYLRDVAGVQTIDCTIFLHTTPAELAIALVNSGTELQVAPQLIAERLWVTMAETVPGAILIAPTSSDWLQLNDLNRFRVAAHEYFHAVQMDRVGPELALRIATTPIDQERGEGPSWLFEGSAEYVSFKALESAGLADLQTFLDQHSLAPDADLRDIETFLEYASGQPDGLVLPLAAVNLLIGGGDPVPLVHFYELLGDGLAWRDAFNQAFGRSVEAFYGEFDSWLRR